jgi:hypothetical protein
MTKTYQTTRKIIYSFPLSIYEKKFLMKIVNKIRYFITRKNPRIIYNYLVVPESCFKSKSREVILR